MRVSILLHGWQPDLMFELRTATVSPPTTASSERTPWGSLIVLIVSMSTLLRGWEPDLMIELRAAVTAFSERLPPAPP